MGWRQYTPSSHATTLESNMSEMSYDSRTTLEPKTLKSNKSDVFLCTVRTNDDCLGWSIIGLQVNLTLPWRKMGEPQSGDGVFSNTPPTAFRLSPS
jgi:hypothetical protein